MSQIIAKNIVQMSALEINLGSFLFSIFFNAEDLF